MALWRKRRFDDSDLDYEAMEEMLAEVLDSLEAEVIDFSKPVKVAFSVDIDSEGFLRVNEFGLMEESAPRKKEEEPLVDVIDMDNEIMVVVETNTLPARDIDVKVMEQAMVISNQRSKKFIKRIPFPCRVNHGSVRTSYNNNVLEVRLAKRQARATLVKEKE